MPTNLMPAELAEIIATHRALFGGFVMQADGETPPAAPNPAPPAAPPAAPAAPPPGDDAGAGGKDALKADLATERDKRQELEQKFQKFAEGIGAALGITPAEVTPEQMAAQLTQATADKDTILQQLATANARLAIYDMAPDGVNVRRLLDSRRFDTELGKVDVTDPAAVQAAITAFLDANPDYRTNPSSGGDLGAGHGRVPATTAPGVPRMAAALEQQLTKN